MQTNELRVFISSTFRDLQEEREHLVKKIFPEIRALCRERGITFTEVDLRWGLTEEQLALGQVIRACLEEVDKCRPYFIGITGDRYGYVPSYLDIQKDPALLEQYPWIEDAAIARMSITEMEAHYAVLGVGSNGIDKRRCDRSTFYIRRHRQSIDDRDDESEERRCLEGYQQRIHRSGAEVEQFRDPATLGEMIYDHLVKIIKRDFAEARPRTPLEEERARHAAFALSRRRAYIANPAYLKRLNDHVASDDPPLVVYAESGSGKSSLFAFWAESYRKRHPEAHVVEHYVGIGATSTDHYAIIRHVCMEVKERFDREEEIPSTPEELEKSFGQWLGYADRELERRDESMVVILDGLNQLQGSALSLRWIPDVVSPRIRMALSSTVEGTLVELRRRGWGQFGMQALSEAEREVVVVRYLAEYRKSLPAEQIGRIASDYKCGHPLFLKTLLEELRLVGQHELLDKRITAYLESTGTEDLFQRVLERLEEDYNMRSVRDVMQLLWGSRDGLDDREIAEITGLARLKVATMAAGLDYHLVRKEGRLTFFHDYLRRAVEKRYLADAARQRSVHLQIADYLGRGVATSLAENTTTPLRTARELAYHLHSGGAIEQLRHCLSTMPLFLLLYDGRTRFEVLGYWSAMGERNDIEESYRRGLEQWTMEDAHERSVGVGQVADLLQRLGHWTEAIDLERERRAAAIERGDRSEEAVSRLTIGWLLQHRGEHEEAFSEYETAREICMTLGDRAGVATAEGNMGLTYFNRGEYDRALECFQQASSIREELGDRHGVASAHGNIGLAYSDRGEYDRALQSYRQQLSIATELGDLTGVASAHVNMGTVYSRRGELDRALESYRLALSIDEELGDRHGISVVNANMGSVYERRGEHDRALECFQRNLSINEELGDRAGEAIMISNIGSIYEKRGDYDRALESFQRALSISEELDERRVVSFVYGNMGLVHEKRGEYDRALECLHRAEEGHRAIGFLYGLGYWLVATARLLVDLDRVGGAMPGYLPKHLPDVSEDRWRITAVQRARTCVEEAVAISDELSIPGMQFSGRILLGRVEAAEGHMDMALSRLQAMLAEATDDEHRAELDYWLWKLGAGNRPDASGSPLRSEEPGAGKEALRLYRQLAEQTPKHEYRMRIEELTASAEGNDA